MRTGELESYIALGLGAALVVFVVLAGALMFMQSIPRSDIVITTNFGPMKLSNMPDPYAVATAAVRSLILLALGLTGAKLLEVGIDQRRKLKMEAQLEQYYQYYQQYQY